MSSTSSEPGTPTPRSPSPARSPTPARRTGGPNGRSPIIGGLATAAEIASSRSATPPSGTLLVPPPPRTPTSAAAVRVHLTLPLACQVCLQRVRSPVACANRHVFCAGCIDEWLRRRKACPACRCPVTPRQPFLPLLGGPLHGDSGDGDGGGRESSRDVTDVVAALVNGKEPGGASMAFSSANDPGDASTLDLDLALTRKRMKLDSVIRDYEDSLKAAQRIIGNLGARVSDLERELAQARSQIAPATHTAVSSPATAPPERTTPPPRQPPADEASRVTPRAQKRPRSPSLPPGSGSGAAKRQATTSSFEPTADDFRNELQWNQRENSRLACLVQQLRAEAAASVAPPSLLTASPVKGSSVIALKVRVSELERENASLNQALLKSDEFIEQLQARLAAVSAGGVVGREASAA
ncbi:hypothetical protein HK405_002792 [Cladochytrium tenue]|nr:hypothetical protein HK405_002792 [Cladochytrium tenue]